MANSELDTLYKTETHTSTRSLTDEELMAGIIGAVRDTRQAMTQDAWKGNLNIASKMDAELNRRAEKSGDNSMIEELGRRLQEAFPDAYRPQA
ncbi:MAG: hypothetical protein A2700_00420 [Candidatus Blackburnbacteria bacterium RIFCSPHIGHO2_01_FULL_44_64]|uniref:Uncharacterized protein n=1 Tax=Candidatus Blackburnbacteria bacterium RIFCSPHIGHO2_02_FULL_44_20 TaxID=1797516 RepID=A0A1G1V664_9BACT|nr:MAG: hypothetical protein A2700_00420 [Candidatus Blackburnbacteria bacterium RIFCSPHIGHO2_01_FULL_44_64]OGY10742.1 MAG: hypothetical protein A3D26_02790 [Candidatus Blackburnbacteria bacterium RIFCSPHIGHO2_02_FULL_44_20]OGY11904.1 MAG: hypothetical protein A3E16_03885 [Candidatus Blackburnbacteria bacterium RIFCSPHIGHO2_12_FULL_44_25]OGY13627.1 MAG: hypothetical protein A3A62_00085 [Candidatus Blackburnbacteria bacterium RIFCSPLOWO2_01_FULL_44_43]OGY17076.1 MAG: hypothetical protein A3H88_0